MATGHLWYMKRVAPIFCSPCRAIYESIYPIKLVTLIIAFILCCVGMILLSGTLVACHLATCDSIVYSILIPVGVLCLVLGYLLFHCAWAAYLLDQPDTNPKIPYPKRVPEHVYTETPHEKDRVSQAEVTGEEIPVDPVDDPNCGYWQFVRDGPWQNKCSLDTLQ